MEEDIEKALNNLWNSLDDEFFNLTYSQEQMKEDIRLILNRYNYLDSKAENLINKYKEQKRDIRDSHILLAKYSQKVEEQEKIIELMNEYILKEYISPEICSKHTPEDCYADIYDDEACKKCILDYFRKKAKGE